MIRCGSLKTVYRFETSLTATVLTSLYVIISAVLYCQGIVIALTIVFTSGITKVGVTRGGNWGCHPHFFLKKWQPFLVITVCLSVLQCHPIIFSWEMMTFFAHHCHLYCFHIDFTRVSPPPSGRYQPALFYLSGLLCPLFFVNSPTIFSFGCHPPEGVTGGGPHPAPLVTPLVYLVHVLLTSLVFAYTQYEKLTIFVASLECDGLRAFRAGHSYAVEIRIVSNTANGLRTTWFRTVVRYYMHSANRLINSN